MAFSCLGRLYHPRGCCLLHLKGTAVLGGSMSKIDQSHFCIWLYIRYVGIKFTYVKCIDSYVKVKERVSQNLIRISPNSWRINWRICRELCGIRHDHRPQEKAWIPAYSVPDHHHQSLAITPVQISVILNHGWCLIAVTATNRLWSILDRTGPCQ